MSETSSLPYLLGSFEVALEPSGLRIPADYLDGCSAMHVRAGRGSECQRLICQSTERSRFNSLNPENGECLQGAIMKLTNDCLDNDGLLAAIGLKEPGDTALIVGCASTFEIWNEKDWLLLLDKWPENRIENLLFGNED